MKDFTLDPFGRGRKNTNNKKCIYGSLIVRYGGGHGGGYGTSHGGGYGGGHGHSKGSGTGTACIVKVKLCVFLVAKSTKSSPYGVQGSYCNCHYCKCEKGHISCGGYGHGGGYGEIQSFETLKLFSGKKYCYGGMEGEYCHCDYCKVFLLFKPSLS